MKLNNSFPKEKITSGDVGTKINLKLNFSSNGLLINKN